MEELSSEVTFGGDFGAERMWGLKELVFLTEGFSPQTVAWLWLAVFLFTLLLIVSWRRYQYWKSQSWRRATLKTLALMHDDFSHLASLPQLLRHAALMNAPRAEVIAASGAAWTTWLNQRAGKTIFNGEDAQLLNRLAYAKNNETDKLQSQHLITATQTWVRGDHA